MFLTGSSAGIGEGIAYHLASLGSKLSITGRDKERLENVKAKCVSDGLPPEKVFQKVK